MKRTALLKRTPLKRRTPLRPRRKNRQDVRIGKVSGTVRLSGDAMERLRERVYRRDGGRCTWKGCGELLPLHGSVFNRAHLAHIKSRGAGGSDTAENTKILCPYHHLVCQHTKGQRDAA
jgi:hypothetical protein